MLPLTPPASPASPCRQPRRRCPSGSTSASAASRASTWSAAQRSFRSSGLTRRAIAKSGAWESEESVVREKGWGWGRLGAVSVPPAQQGAPLQSPGCGNEKRVL
eukprot:200196-Chlamydomonas_euryale.AAC.1